MSSFRKILTGFFLIVLVLCTTSAFAAKKHSTSTSRKSSSHSNSSRSTSHSGSSHKASSSQSRSRSGHARKTSSRAMPTPKKSRSRGQQSIEPERVTQIQQALVRARYMSGEPTGSWDSTTAAAMQKFQADQGWQTKRVPDSRAIKKLGLGPDYSNAINAKDGNFVDPPSDKSLPTGQESGFTSASGVSR